VCEVEKEKGKGGRLGPGDRTRAPRTLEVKGDVKDDIRGVELDILPDPHGIVALIGFCSSQVKVKLLAA
jgi:hypothetical protein